ncbi:MAG: GNAT family N-acetyltransferase [Myxococcaceae bacterium]|nr:GNAT family N-acetyltransferase [Myxococcaceae bacterium]
MEPLPSLDAGSCRLRALRVEDADAWFRLLEDPVLRRLTSWSIGSVDEVRELIVDLTQGARAATTRRWAIERDGQFVGTCGFKHWDRAARTAEVAYELAAGLRRQGLMRAVFGVVLRHGWAALSLERVSAVVMEDNVASQRLLEGAGFRRTARLPAFRVCGGRLRDFHRFECLRPSAAEPTMAR